MNNKIKIRKKFPKDFDPSTKVHHVKTEYDRKSNRDEIEAALEEMEEDREFDGY